MNQQADHTMYLILVAQAARAEMRLQQLRDQIRELAYLRRKLKVQLGPAGARQALLIDAQATNAFG
ncbi:MAG: hypothetical protein V3S19_07180 [Gemmatimonadales bacterium]